MCLLFTLDAVARNTRSKRPVITEEEMDYRKRLRMSSFVVDKLYL